MGLGGIPALVPLLAGPLTIRVLGSGFSSAGTYIPFPEGLAQTGEDGMR